MPKKKRLAKQRRGLREIEWVCGSLRGENAWAYLIDELEGDGFLTRFELDHDYQGCATELWRDYGEAAVAEFAKKHPGKRPTMWWRFSAPELRRKHESEAAYLQRLGLFLPGERARLGKAAS